MLFSASLKLNYSNVEKHCWCLMCDFQLALSCSKLCASLNMIAAFIAGKQLLLGPSIKYVMLILANFNLPCHTLSHIPGPPPIFIGPSTKIPNKNLCTNSLSIVRGGSCQGVFCLEGFVWVDFCPFPLLSEYICYNRKLNITLNFMFHRYGKKFISVTSHALDPLPLSHPLGPPPPRA